MYWLKKLSVTKKLSIIISFILLILVLGLINFWFSLKVMSSIRSYVGGEGLWSKAQKSAISSLVKYSTTKEESDYQDYLKHLQVPLGDKQARQELDKKHPNLEIARDGFIKGGNNSQDVNDLIFLYRRFRWVSYMDTAIQDWTEGDKEIEELIKTGNNIRTLVIDSKKVKSPASERSDKINSLIDDVYNLDKKLTILENHFSSTLGEGSRKMREILFLITFFLSFVLGSIVLFISVFIGRIIIQVDNMKNEFITITSHELQTPMAAIKGYLSMILTEKYGAVTDTMRTPLMTIKKATDRLIALVQDILNVSLIETNQLRITLQQIYVKSIVDEVIDNLQPIIFEKNTNVNNKIDPRIIVQADQQKLSQIFINLIGNSLKFTDNGMINIISDEKSDSVIITISDTGQSIDKNDQKKLFGKFQQISSQSSGRPSGTGLGLYISRKYAQAMGGELWFVDSTVDNKNTSFSLSIPKAGSTLAKRSKQMLIKGQNGITFFNYEFQKNSSRSI